MEKVLLEMRQIDKIFPGVRALSKVDFTLRAGEIHSLMGENGAGKSTLVKVLTGVYPRDGGTVLLDGKEIAPRTPKEAQECGISTVYQEVNLCPNLSVAENIFIGREPKKHGFIDWKAMNTRAEELLQRLNVNIDVTKTLDNYSVAMQQMIAIARAVDVSAKILILDEPTSSLDGRKPSVFSRSSASCSSRAWALFLYRTFWNRFMSFATASRYCATANSSAPMMWRSCQNMNS